LINGLLPAGRWLGYQAKRKNPGLHWRLERSNEQNMSVLRSLAQSPACRKKRDALQNPGALLAFLSYGKLSKNLFHGPDKNQILEDVIGDSPKSGCFSETSLQSSRHDLFPLVRLLQHANSPSTSNGCRQIPIIRTCNIPAGFA
jgi:hypothetical protein